MIPHTLASMFSRAGLAALPQLLRTLRPAPVAAMSTGTFVVSQPLNYRGGARVEPADASGTEKAFEPATGNGTETGGGAGSALDPRGQGTGDSWCVACGLGVAGQRPDRVREARVRESCPWYRFLLKARTGCRAGASRRTRWKPAFGPRVSRRPGDASERQ